MQLKVTFRVIFALACLQTYLNAAFVDPQYKLVEWEGWGTSLTWFGDVLGGLSQPVQDEVIEALFSPEKLNLNIVQYVIGGTTPGDNCTVFRPGAATESFRDSAQSVYRWERDPRTRKILLAAQARGADIFEAIVRSPPSWLTRSGCTNGNSNASNNHDNFDPRNANAFADYITEVVKYYDTHLLSFDYLSPISEPLEGHFVGGSTAAEGCNMELSTAAEIIKSVYAALDAKGLPSTYPAVSSGSPTNEILTQKFFADARVNGLYAKINVKGHLKTERIAELYSMSERNGHKLWAVYSVARKSSLEDMRQGLEIAEMIRWNLRDASICLGYIIKIYFQAAEDLADATARGLIDVPFKNDSVDQIVLNSGYYSMMQFSKYITKGFTIVHVNDWETVAAYNFETLTLVLVSTNAESETIKKEFDLRAFESVGKIVVFRTSSFEPHVPVAPPYIEELRFSFDLPPRSVTTFVLSHTAWRRADNLLRNSNFELPLPTPWQLLYGRREDNGVNGRYAFKGIKSGYLNFEESKLSLVQNVTVSQTRAYYLSAWCAAEGPSTLLGVMINGYQGPEITINSGKGYQLYGLTVDAKVNDVLSVYLHAEKGNYTAQIDDVVLH